jgi:anti-sigma factor RsiW
MSSACNSPLAFETLVAYWAADLDQREQDAVEEHLIGCGTCSAESARIAAITETYRQALPPLLTPELLAQLRAKGLRVRENPIAPGEINVAVLDGTLDLMVHRLGGLALADAQRVSFEMRPEGSDHVMMALSDAPVDRAGNAVLVACHAHYASLPHDVVVDVHTHRADGSDVRTSYTIRHLFR